MDFGLFGTVVLTVKNLGYFCLERLYELLHAFFQIFPAPGRQTDTFWAIRLFEIVDITRIRRGRFLFGCLFKKGPGNIRQSSLGLSRHENIVIDILHAHAEFERFDSSLLSHHSFLGGAEAFGGIKT